MSLILFIGLLLLQNTLSSTKESSSEVSTVKKKNHILDMVQQLWQKQSKIVKTGLIAFPVSLTVNGLYRFFHNNHPFLLNKTNAVASLISLLSLTYSAYLYTKKKDPPTETKKTVLNESMLPVENNLLADPLATTPQKPESALLLKESKPHPNKSLPASPLTLEPELPSDDFHNRTSPKILISSLQESPLTKPSINIDPIKTFRDFIKATSTKLKKDDLEKQRNEIQKMMSAQETENQVYDMFRELMNDQLNGEEEERLANLFANNTITPENSLKIFIRLGKNFTTKICKYSFIKQKILSISDMWKAKKIPKDKIVNQLSILGPSFTCIILNKNLCYYEGILYRDIWSLFDENKKIEILMEGDEEQISNILTNMMTDIPQTITSLQEVKTEIRLLDHPAFSSKNKNLIFYYIFIDWLGTNTTAKIINNMIENEQATEVYDLFSEICNNDNRIHFDKLVMILNNNKIIPLNAGKILKNLSIDITKKIITRCNERTNKHIMGIDRVIAILKEFDDEYRNNLLNLIDSPYKEEIIEGLKPKVA